MVTLSNQQLLRASEDFSGYVNRTRKDRKVSIILLDGLGEDVLTELLRAGRLPNLQGLIAEGGFVPHAVTSFPSMTGYGFYPFLTGKAAPSSGIVGLRWFRRNSQSNSLSDSSNSDSEIEAGFRNYVGSNNPLLNRDVSGSVPLLFERFSGVSSSINTYLNRGVALSHKLGWALTTAKYSPFAWYLRALALLRPILGAWVCRLSYEEFEEASFDAALEDLQLHDPDVQWITAASIDSYAHVFGHSDPPRLHQVVVAADAQIGRYVAFLKRRHMWDDRVVLVAADHGIAHVSQPLGLPQLLHAISPHFSLSIEALRLSPWVSPTPVSAFAANNAIAAINGNNMAHLYFRSPHYPPLNLDGWLHRPAWSDLRQYSFPSPSITMASSSSSSSIDIIEELALSPGVGLVLYRMRRSVHVRTHLGHAVISCWNCASPQDNPPPQPLNSRIYSYSVVSDADPLGILSDSQTLSLRRYEWLAGTLHSDFPFAPPRIYELFEADAAGDVVISAAPGYDFGKDIEIFIGDNKGGHGGLHRQQTVVSYVVVGPDVVPGSVVDTALPEDMGATLIRMVTNATALEFDQIDAKSLDGRVLYELIRS